MSVEGTSSEHLIAFEPDHETQILDRMLRQFCDRPRIQAFLKATAAVVQQLENDLYDIVEAALIGDHTPRDLLERWGAIVGERDAGSLSRTQLLDILCARIRANTIGIAVNKATVSGYLRLLEQAFAPSTLTVTMFPSGTPVITITVNSGPGATYLPDGVADRATAVARVGRPIGTLIVLVEANETTAIYGSTPLGYGATYGRLLYAGLE